MENEKFLMEAKLYSPVFVEAWEYDDYGSLIDESIHLDQESATWFRDEISTAILKERLSDESERGLMTYYYENDLVRDKVHSLFVDVEVIDGMLWAVSTLKVNEALTNDEINALKNYVEGQFADGFGEGFEQREINVEHDEIREINVHLWSNGYDFFIDTQKQFSNRLGIELPDDILSQPALTLLDAKLYSPVFVDFLEHNKDGERAFNRAELEQYCTEYMDEISEELWIRLSPEESTRGLMEGFEGDASINEKVHSIFVDVEPHDYKLWAVAEIKLTEPLSDVELATLMDYLTDQYSDGWGNGFSYRDIAVAGGEVNVHLWQPSDNFIIETQQQFSQRIGIELPADAFSQPAQSISLSPAQKSLNEPNMLENKETSSLYKQLTNRLNQNLTDYMGSIKHLEGVELTQISSRIAVMAEAHNYLIGQHNFHPSELEYLLQFKNPLEVVADEFDSQVPNDLRHTEMWRIFDKQEALAGGYELVTESTRPSIDTPITTDDCLPDSSGMDFEGQVVAIKAEILYPEYRTASHQLHVAMSGFGCSPTALGRAVICKNIYDGEEVRFNRSDVAGVVKPECLPKWTQEKLTEIPEYKADKSPIVNNPLNTKTKPSVIEEIRQSQKASQDIPKEKQSHKLQPPQQLHDKEFRKKSEQDL